MAPRLVVGAFRIVTPADLHENRGHATERWRQWRSHKMKKRSALPAAAGDYFARRGLRRFAGAWSLWALGVSIVIPGEFSGWNYGLLAGGFGGLLVATLIIVVMYLCLCFSLAEMSAAMPFAGGGYGFARCALGPLGGYLAGLAQNIEFILTAAAVVVSVGEAANALLVHLFGSALPEPLLWAAAYLVFTVVNIYGIELTCRIALLLAALALGVLAFFAVSAVPHFDFSLALDIPVAAHGSPWLPYGVSGIAWSIPFAVWFLVAIEMLTLSAEEAEQPERNLPKGILYGIATLIVAALLVLFLNSAVPPGAKAVGEAAEPLLLAFGEILGGRFSAGILALCAFLSYIAGFHATIFAYGRSIYAQARAGYLPSALSLTHPVRRTPHFALLAGGAAGYCAALLVKLAPHDLHVDAILLNMAVFAAIVSYVIQMLSFLVLRRRLPQMKRPFVSPLGATGAMTALVISGGAGLLMLLNRSYELGLLGCAAAFVIGTVYFVLCARHRVVAAAPEEIFAAEHRPMMAPSPAAVPLAGEALRHVA
jgi:ethanolamine permease